MSEFFVSHTLPDTAYCRQLVLPVIEAVVDRSFNQCVFMNRENFGKASAADGTNADLLAKAYSKEVDRLLRDSRFMLLVASTAATRSDWVRYEVRWWAENRSVTEMLVLLREPCEPQQIHSAAGRCESLALFNPSNGDEAAKLKGTLVRMLSASTPSGT
jgi:hypothetical protein